MALKDGGDVEAVGSDLNTSLQKQGKRGVGEGLARGCSDA